MILLMAADVALHDQHESVQSGVGLFAFLSLFRKCPSDVGNLAVVTLGVVSKTDERVSQDARESHQLRYLAIGPVQARIHLGVVVLLFHEELLELCLLFQKKRHSAFELLVVHSIFSCRKYQEVSLAYTFEVSSVE